MSNSNINKKFKVNPYINEKNQSIFAGIGVAVVSSYYFYIEKILYFKRKCYRDSKY